MTARILRLRRPSDLLTAQVYEALFDDQIARRFPVTVVDSTAFCDAVLGASADELTPGRMRLAAFRDATAHVDFMCPNFEAAPLAPALLAVRNASGAAVRLLFISHATGTYAPEWSLLAPLLRPGDVIITPSHDARVIALALDAALAPYVHVVSHPMAPLGRVRPAARRSTRPHIVSLGRVHAHKLIHRQIEAIALLRRQGELAPTLTIGGPLDDAGWSGPHPYTRALQAKASRLGLDGIVRFHGAVRGVTEKAKFLSDADVVCNLSVTLEESFPKTPVEALGLGIPVLATRWTGLRETVGPHGVLLPVTPVDSALGGMDVSAESVAAGMVALLDASPSPQACAAHAAQFAPAVMLARYAMILERALADRDASSHRSDGELPAWTQAATPSAGLLAGAAPLTAMSWRDWFAVYTPWTLRVRAAWQGRMPTASSWCDEIRRLLAASVQPALERIAAREDDSVVTALVPQQGVPRSPSREEHAESFDAALMPAVLTQAVGLPETSAAGRLTGAAALLPAGANVLREVVSQLPLTARERLYWSAMASLSDGRAALALEEARAACDAAPLTEHDWPYVRLVSRAARRSGTLNAAISTLQQWLDDFPDAQESGPIWLELAVCHARACAWDAADIAVTEARRLLGPLPSVTKCAAMIATGARYEVLVG